MVLNGSTKSRSWTFRAWKVKEVLFLLLISDFTRPLIEVIEYARFQNSYVWNDNRFISHGNRKRFWFYCDLSAFEQHLGFRALRVIISGYEVTPTPQVRWCPCAYGADLIQCYNRWHNLFVEDDLRHQSDVDYCIMTRIAFY